MLRSIEFNGLPDGEVEVRHNHDVFVLQPSHTEFIRDFMELLKEKKPIAFESLCERYIKSKQNNQYYNFLIVRGFIKCNFIIHDNKLDIDEEGNFVTEFFLCPRIGECKEFNRVCNCPDNTNLSVREVEVLKLIAEGYTNVEISDILYLSPNTVHVHRNNILRKRGLNNTADMTRYYYKNFKS